MAGTDWDKGSMTPPADSQVDWDSGTITEPGAEKSPGILRRFAHGAGRAADSMRAATGGAESIAGIAGEQARTALPQSSAAQQMEAEYAPYRQAANNAEGFTNTAKAWGAAAGKRIGQFATNPGEVAGMMAEQIPNSLPGLAGGIAGAKLGAMAGTAVAPGLGTLTGGVLGGLAGGFAGSFGIERGGALLEQTQKEAQARGIPITDTSAVTPMLAEKFGEFSDTANRKAAATAGVDAALNMATMGVAGAGARSLQKAAMGLNAGVKAGTISAADAATELAKLEARSAARNTLGAKALRGTGVVGAEMVGEGASEAAGQLYAYGKADAGDVIDEALLGLGQGGAMAVGNKAFNKVAGIADTDATAQALKDTRAFVDGRLGGQAPQDPLPLAQAPQDGALIAAPPVIDQTPKEVAPAQDTPVRTTYTEASRDWASNGKQGDVIRVDGGFKFAASGSPELLAHQERIAQSAANRAQSEAGGIIDAPPIKPSESMGLNPAAGPMSAAAATAVDTGAHQPIMGQSLTGSPLSGMMAQGNPLMDAARTRSLTGESAPDLVGERPNAIRDAMLRKREGTDAGNSGDVRGMDSAATGSRGDQPGAGVGAGVGDSGAAGPAVDAGRAFGVPVGGDVPPVARGSDAGRDGAVAPSLTGFKLGGQGNSLVQEARNRSLTGQTATDFMGRPADPLQGAMRSDQAPADDVPQSAQTGTQASPAPGAQGAPQAGPEVAEKPLPSALSAKLQEAHKALGRDVTRPQVQAMRDRIAREVSAGQSNNGGVAVNLRPLGIKTRQAQLTRLDADLALFDEPSQPQGATSEPQADQAQQTAAQQPQAPAEVGPAPATDEKLERSKRIAEAGAAWTRMPSSERQALVGRLTGLKPVIQKNLHTAVWENLNGDIQRKLADAMAQVDAVEQARPVTSPAAAKTSPYSLPEKSVDADWRDADGRDYTHPDYRPTERQKIVIQATTQAMDEGIRYNREMGARVAELLDVDRAKLPPSRVNVEGGEFWYDVYHAKGLIERQRSRKTESETAGQMALKTGDVIGTVVTNDGKRITGLTIESVSDDGTTAKVVGKRGVAKISGHMQASAIKNAIQRAKDEGKRKDGYDEFAEKRKPASPPAITQATAVSNEIQGETAVAAPETPGQTGPYGRDLTPVSQGGKPFKTKEEADTFRKANTNGMVTRKQGKGYVITEASDKQIAAWAKAAKRIGAARTSPKGEPIPAHSFIAAEGGMHLGTRKEMSIDGNPRIGNRFLFGESGMTIERATELMKEHGYLPAKASHTDAISLIKRSLTNPQYTAEGWERIGEAERQAQFDDYLSAEEDRAADPLASLVADDFDKDDVAGMGYDEANQALQLEVNALIAQAEARGLDVDTIQEDAYEGTRNGTQQDYLEAARAALAQAIEGSDGNRGPDSGEQGDAAGQEGLTAPTREDIEAQQDRAEQVARSEEAARRKADQQAGQDEDRKRIAKASEAAADTFMLGGDAMDNLTGQGDIFSAAPDQKEADAPAPKAQQSGQAKPAEKKPELFTDPVTGLPVVAQNKATADAMARSKTLDGKATVRKATADEMRDGAAKFVGYEQGEERRLGYVLVLNDDAAPARQEASKTPTVDRHEALMESVREGKATAEQFKAAFESLVASKDAVLAELETKTKAELLKAGGYYFQTRHANEKKADVAGALYREMLDEYVLGAGYSYGMDKGAKEAAVRSIVEATDDARLEQYAKDRQAAIAEAQSEREAKARALENPKTLDDFRAAIRAEMQDGKTRKEAFLSLTPEQRIQYDTLDAESTREAREARKRAAKAEVRAAGQATGGEIIATKHTRDGYDLFVVKLADRVSKEDYSTLLSSAKRMGGWYSAFRGNGAIPGFQFKDKANAEAFLQLASGDASAAQGVAEQRRDAFADDRSQTAVERLTEMADRMEGRADESLNAERKTNTARRARFANAAEAAASADKAMAKTMRNIAQAIDSGKAKFLDAVRQKTQVEMLAGITRTAKDNELRAKHPSYAEQEKRKGEPATAETADFAEFPGFTAFRSDLATLARQLLEVDGTKKIGQQLMKVADDVTDAYLGFAKENLLKVSQYATKDGQPANFIAKDAAERAIKKSNLVGKAIVLPVKRGENRIILSPSEAMNRGVWTGDGDKRITLSREFGHEMVQAIGRRANKDNRLTVPWQFENAAERLNALARMGIETPAEFRSALREFIGLREQAQEADRVKTLERAMVGRKNDSLDFFPTPQAVADQMVEAAGIEPDMAVLEPSAGMGHIADRIRAAGAEPDVIEMAADRQELLEEKGFTVVGRDFMDMKPRDFFTYGDVFRAPDGSEGVMRGESMSRVRLVGEAGAHLGYFNREELTGVRHMGAESGYDRIIMNPPFSNGRDIEHVRHAFTLLKPGGRLVAIMGESAFTNQNKKATEFREWLEQQGGTEEKLEAGTFMDPSLPVNTGANARMVVLDRPAGEQTKEDDAGNVAMFSRSKAQSANEEGTRFTRLWYDRLVRLLPASYRNDPHRREPLPAEGGDVQRASEVQSKVDALNKELRGPRDTKGYGPVSIDPLGNLQVDARSTDSFGIMMDVKMLADALGYGVVVTGVRSSNIQMLRDAGFVSEISLAAIADRAIEQANPTDQTLTGYQAAAARAENRQIDIPQTISAVRDSGTIMSYKPRGFPMALFSRTHSARQFSRVARIQATKAVEATAKALQQGMANGPKVVVAFDMGDPAIPEAVRKADDKQRSGGAKGAPEGFYYKGVVYLMASKLSTPADVARVFAHEVLGHHGLRGLFGDKLKPILQQIATMRKAEVDAKIKEYGLRGVDSLDRLTAAEEVLAEMAQTTPTLGFVTRAVAAIRTWLRDHIPGFGKMALTDSEIIANYILPARGWVENGGGNAGLRSGMAFSRDTKQSVTNPNDVVGNQGGRSADDNSPGVWAESLPRAGNEVDGRTVRGHIPNRSSIDASISNNEILPGVRAVPLSAFDYQPGKPDQRTIDLAEQINESGEINPLIVGVDDKGPYIIEGGHRLDALIHLGAKELPALVVIDRDEVPNESPAPTSDGAMFSRATTARDLTQKATAFVNDFMSVPGKLDWWSKTVGTQYHTAQRYPAFKPVYESIQNFINDVSLYATEAADMAPKLLPRLDTLKDIAKKPVKGEDAKAIAAPIFEGTLSWTRDASGQPVKTDDVQKAGIVWTPEELKGLFKLTDEQIGLYQEFRRSVDESLLSLSKSHMLYVAGKDATGLRDAVMAAKTIDEASALLQDRLAEVAESGSAAVAAEAGRIGGRIIETADQARSLMARGYAPLTRFGRYTLDVVANGERQYFGMFESQFEAAKMANALRQKFPGAQVTRGTMSEQSYKLFSGVTPETAELFGEMMGVTDKEAFQEYIKLAKSTRSAMKRMIKREGIAGFSEDAGRVLAGFVYSNARQTARNLHMGDMDKAASDIPKEQGELKDHAINLVEYIKNPTDEAQAIRGLLFAQYIGGSIASAMVNMTQPFTMSLPWLSQFGGMAQAGRQMSGAVRDVMRRKTGDAQLDAALKRAEEDGTVSPQEVFDLMKQAQGKASLSAGDGTAASEARAAASNAVTRIGFGWGKMFSAAEQFNRRTTFIAAYRTAVEQKMADPDAFARRAIVETQGAYNRGNKPRWAHGAVGATLFTFKQFSVAYLEMLHRMATRGEPGSPERIEGMKAVAYSLGILVLMSGLSGLPGGDDLDDVVSGIGQAMGYNFDSRTVRQRFLSELMGDDWARFMERGVSGLPGVPIDVSGRMGLGNLIPGTGLFTKKQDHTRDVAEIAGPAGDLIKRAFEAVGAVVKGNVLGKGGAVESIAPKAAANLMQGVDMADKGMYRDKTGKKLVETDEADAVAKMLGFQPAGVKRVQDASIEVQRMIGLNKIRESEIADRWAMGLFEKDQEKVKAARDDLLAWNKDNPESPIAITFPQIMQRVKKMNQTKAERIADTAPREIRRQVRRELTQ